MIVDSSVLVAILSDEPERRVLVDLLTSEAECNLSVANYLEVNMVLSDFEPRLRRLESLLKQAEIKILPVTLDQGHLAIEAFRSYGKSRHPAKLNYGDCFAYALAKERGEPLLFKGDDFSKTDIQCVEY